ncbi:MAG: hypothetical protein NTX50_11050 [Candidatus Sumerlaeota bacterium]|nr:hypothetical protein [Candidatus Sumerlaeota bacterium]
MANEIICAEIGRFLRLPVPPHAILHGPRSQPGPWFGSLDFKLAGDALPPVDPLECVQLLPYLSTGVLLFDILVANCDRHRGNLALDGLSAPPHLSVFDHSHALFGYTPGQGRERLIRIKEQLGVSGGSETGSNRHCLLDAVSTDEYITPWVERIASIPDFFIEDVCKEPRPFGLSDQETGAVIDFLRYRRDHFRELINANRDEFTGIKQWEILP